MNFRCEDFPQKIFVLINWSISAKCPCRTQSSNYSSYTNYWSQRPPCTLGHDLSITTPLLHQKPLHTMISIVGLIDLHLYQYYSQFNHLWNLNIGLYFQNVSVLINEFTHLINSIKFLHFKYMIIYMSWPLPTFYRHCIEILFSLTKLKRKRKEKYVV